MMFMEYWHLSRKFSWEEQFSWKDNYIWKPTIQVAFSWSSALISRLTEDWDGRLFIKENLDMNTVMILPEVHLTLQIQSFLCLLPYLTSSVMLLCPSYPNVLFFPVTLSLIFSFSHNILKDDSAALFSREQKHTVEMFFFLHGCIFFLSLQSNSE